MYDRCDLDLGEGAMQRYFVSVIEGVVNTCLVTVGYAVLHAEIGTAAQYRDGQEGRTIRAAKQSATAVTN
jgi:hypothetical protein